jgi:hypothetical protein
MDGDRYKIVRKENLSDPGCDVKTVVGHEAAKKEKVKMTQALTDEERDAGVYFILEEPRPPLKEGPPRKRPWRRD